MSVRATDRAGNVAHASFSVVVTERRTDALKIEDPIAIAREATGPSGAVVDYRVKAREARHGDVPVTCLPASGATFPIGETIVTCQATFDGTTEEATFTVTVRDTRPPVLDLPDRITVETTSRLGAIVSYTATATDLVDGSVPVVCAPASGSRFAMGRTDVRCTATDRAGNTRDGSFEVVVREK